MTMINPNDWKWELVCAQVLYDNLYQVNILNLIIHIKHEEMHDKYFEVIVRIQAAAQNDREYFVKSMIGEDVLHQGTADKGI